MVLLLPLFGSMDDVQIEQVEEALLYLSTIGALKLDGGFMVLYNAMAIHRLKDMKLRYKQEDYRMLDEFYKQKIQQVHIVGEYANLMVRDYAAAQQYVQDYFQMDYKRFVGKYFKGERGREIQRNITPKKYQRLFDQLSDRQKEIISDKESRCIVVAAGPGSGKTRVLVHKLASLLLLEDVKHEQLLMLTFSRAAATEFKQRLIGLIGESAYYVDIKTFHSYSFDLLGRIGNLEDAGNVVARAAEMISQGEVEPSKIGKTVIVIDEAQDMSAEEYALVRALMTNNEAVMLVALLRKHGIQGKLIQSMDGFRFSNLAEVKYLQKYISRRVTTPLIPDEVWEEAKRATFSMYDGSRCLPYVERCVQMFERTNRAKYRTDLWEFVFESSVEDFCDVSGSDVVVSTIHKAKGREFDDVYMLVSDRLYKDVDMFRQLYVGMTRAKNRLFIHTNSDLFTRLAVDKSVADNRQYPMPEKIMLQLTHKDVFLGFFKPIKKDVLALRSGDALTLEGNYFYTSSTHRAIAKLSANMQATIAAWQEKGYQPSKASVRFVVAWKPKDAPKEEPETAVLLIDLVLK